MHIFSYLWNHMLHSEKAKPIRFSVIALLTLSIIFGMYINYEQPEKTIIDIIYYLVTTSTTVGYGDISPVTATGKILSIFYMLFGIVLLALLFGELTERLQRLSLKEREGEIIMKGPIKLLIVGYPSEDKVKELVIQLKKDESFKNKKIVCISNTIEKKPEWFSKFKVKFKKGVASNSEVLKDIGIHQVEIALILAENSDDITSDDTSSSAVAVIEALNPKTRTIVEKVRPDDLLFTVSKADVITRVAHANLLAQEILDEGAMEFESYIFNNDNGGTQLNVVCEKETNWKDLAISHIMEDKTTLGYRNPGESKFNFTPKLNDIIKKGAIIKYRGLKR